MTRDETKRLLLAIDSIYDNFNPKDLSFTIDTWTMLLSDYSYREMELALKMYVAKDNKGYPPKPGQLMFQLRCFDDGDMSEMEAWSKVRKAIGMASYHSQEAFNNLDDVSQKAVGSARNLKEWSLMPTDEVDSVIHSQFLRSYRNIRQRKNEIDRLPDNIKKLIIGTANKLSIEGGANECITEKRLE